MLNQTNAREQIAAALLMKNLRRSRPMTGRPVT
jgi:hypothetical protein